MKIVIAGGGASGFEAANAAVKTNPDAEVILCCKENILPYRRPQLPMVLKSGELAPERFFIKQEKFYQEQHIKVRFGCNVCAVSGNTVQFDGGSSETFDRLVIATGSVPFVPELPGRDNKNIFVMRDFADVEALQQAVAAKPRRAVILGGGILGLECADALLEHGMEVTVLEHSERLFSRNLDEVAANDVMKQLSAIAGLKILCNTDAAAFTAEGIVLRDGTMVPGDIIIVSCGVRADISWAQAAGLAVGRGIKVDEKMMSSQQNIFACGDVAEFGGRTFGLYADAMATGKVAGANAAGGEALFAPAAPTPLRCFTLGLKLVMQG